MLRLALLLALSASASAQTADSLVAAAQAAYQSGQPAECARLYGEAFDRAPATSRAAYDAACCAALADRPDAAFRHLHTAIAAGYRNFDWLQRDGDLASLRDRPEWAGVTAAAEAAHEVWLATLNRELYEVYRQDQADRMTRPIDWDAVSVRDSLRQRAVGQMLLDGAVVTADDHVHAAMVYQHGGPPEAFLLANRLARAAVALDSTHALARQLVAMTHDRYLWNTGRPQVYGTQSKMTPDGLWTDEPFDPDAVTDAERAAAGVLTLEAQREWRAQRNARILEQREADGE